METIKELNNYCIKNNKRIVLCGSKLKGFITEPKQKDLFNELGIRKI
jgi:hypothetical protein